MIEVKFDPKIKGATIMLPKKYEAYKPDWERIFKTAGIKLKSGYRFDSAGQSIEHEIKLDFERWRTAQDLLSDPT